MAFGRWSLLRRLANPQPRIGRGVRCCRRRHPRCRTNLPGAYDDAAELSYIDKSNNLGRLFRWRQAFLNLFDHPLLGSGLGTFGGSAGQKYGYFTGISMDSVWIRVLAETGMLGFITYVAWMASSFAGVATRFFRSGDKLWLFASIGLLALLVNLFTDNLLDSWAIALVMWSVFGLAAIPEAGE